MKNTCFWLYYSNISMDCSFHNVIAIDKWTLKKIIEKGKTNWKTLE